MRRILPLIIGVFCFVNAFSQKQYILSGLVTDEKKEAIPFVSIYIRNSTYGTVANEHGKYALKLTPGSYNIMYRFVGYKEKTVQITITDKDEEVNVQMQDEIFSLQEVAITGKRTTDPGMDIMREVVKKREHYLNELNAYSCAVYIKGVQKLTKAPKQLMGKEVRKALDLDANGRGILYQSESLSEFNYQRPGKVKEVTISSKVAGQNTAFSYNKASDLQVNLYENIFSINGLSSRGFVTPVADNAFDFYRFELEGTTLVNGKTIDKIKVIPRRKYSQAFQGNIYIIHDDWRIYSADLFLTGQNNSLNLVDTLKISQQYVPVKDDVWMPVSVQLDFNGKVLGFEFEGYYIGVYNNYKLEPNFASDFFNGEIFRVDTASNKRDSTYWANTRPLPLTAQEQRDYVKKDSVFEIRNTPAYKDSAERADNKFNPLHYVIFDYTAERWRTKETFTVEPLHRILFYNTVEGFGIDLKVNYNKRFDDRRNLNVTPVLHYGFASKLFSPHVSATYLYNPQKRSALYTNFGSDVLDLNNVGTRSLFFNTVSTLVYETNHVKYYRAKYANVGHMYELANGIVWDANIEYAHRYQLYNQSYVSIRDVKNKEFTSNNPLAPETAPANDRSFLFPTHNALTFRTSLEFTFDQKYATYPTYREYLPSKYPKLKLNYRKGINKMFGSGVNYDFASVDVWQDDIDLKLLGHSSFKITAGGFLNRRHVYYMDYNHFLGNVGTTFDPTYVGSFHFLPFYEFSTNRGFVEAHYFHNFSGILFNKIPFLRKLKLEEVVGGNYLNSGGLRNYSEFYVGIKKLFFRLDYGISFVGNKKYIQGIRIYYGIR